MSKLKLEEFKVKLEKIILKNENTRYIVIILKDIINNNIVKKSDRKKIEIYDL